MLLAGDGFRAERVKGLRKDGSILNKNFWGIFPVIRDVGQLLFKFIFILECRTVLFPIPRHEKKVETFISIRRVGGL